MNYEKILDDIDKTVAILHLQQELYNHNGKLG